MISVMIEVFMEKKITNITKAINSCLPKDNFKKKTGVLLHL